MQSFFILPKMARQKWLMCVDAQVDFESLLEAHVRLCALTLRFIQKKKIGLENKLETSMLPYLPVALPEHNYLKLRKM